MDLFERLAQGRPPPEPAKTPPTPSAAPVLLDWLQRFWTKPVISLREIYRHGPTCVRWNKQNALKAASILEKTGWLIAIKGPTNAKRWQVAVAAPEVEFGGV